MSRSSKKGPYVDEKLLKKIAKVSPGSKTAIRTWARASVISPEMVGYTFDVHNGRNFIPVIATEEMVGHRLGEFAPTRRFSRHGGRLQREIEQKSTQSAESTPQPENKNKSK